LVKTADLFKVNTKMDVQVKEGIYYKTSVQEITDDYIAIYVPSYKGRELQLVPGDYIKARVYSEDAQYVFNTTVLGRKEERIVLYLLAHPVNVKRVQKRDYVRVKVQIPVRYQVMEEMTIRSGVLELTEEAFSIDISGGGMQLLVSKSIETNKLLALKFYVQDSKKNDIAIRAVARVKRKEKLHTGRNKYSLGICFEEISEKDRDLVIAFVFRKILEQRRLGVE